jgi:hypothetical protein
MNNLFKRIEENDTSGYWGESKFDSKNRQIEYSDYSGFHRSTKYLENGNIIQLCNNGNIFEYVLKENGKYYINRRTGYNIGIVDSICLAMHFDALIMSHPPALSMQIIKSERIAHSVKNMTDKLCNDSPSVIIDSASLLSSKHLIELLNPQEFDDKIGEKHYNTKQVSKDFLKKKGKHY